MAISHSETSNLETRLFAKDLVMLVAYNKEQKTRTEHQMPFLDLAAKIELAADAISDLRLNSTASVVESLKLIAADIRGVGKPDDAKIVVIGDPRPRVVAVFRVLGQLFDIIDNSRLASIIVSGAVTALVSAGGWSSVTCMSLVLASWHGKDAYLAALNRFPVGNGSKKVLSTKPDPFERS